MMYESSLPIWLEILIVDLFVAILCGLFAPYVTKHDRERADAYLHNNRRGKCPVVTVSVHEYFRYTSLVVLLIALASVAAFIFDGFSTAVNCAGGGLLAVVAVIFGVIFMYLLTSVALILLASLVAYRMSCEIERYYRGYYFVEVKQDIY